MKVVRRPVMFEAEALENQRMIHTMYGNALADAGDFVITGFDGEQHPVCSEHFALLYEVVPEGEANENYELFDDYDVSAIGMAKRERYLERLLDAREKERDRFQKMYEEALDKACDAVKKLESAEDEVQDYKKRYNEALLAYHGRVEDGDAKSAQLEELTHLLKQFEETADEQAATIQELEQELRLLKSDKEENDAVLDRLNAELTASRVAVRDLRGQIERRSVLHEDDAIPVENISVGAIRLCDGSLKLIENGEQVFNVISFEAEITAADGFEYTIRRRRHIAPAQGLSAEH